MAEAPAGTRGRTKPQGVLQRLMYLLVVLAMHRAATQISDRKKAAARVDPKNPAALAAHAEEMARQRREAVERLMTFTTTDMTREELKAALTDAISYCNESPIARAKLDDLIVHFSLYGLDLGQTGTTLEVSDDVPADFVESAMKGNAAFRRERAAAEAASAVVTATSLPADAQQELTQLFADWSGSQFGDDDTARVTPETVQARRDDLTAHLDRSPLDPDERDRVMFAVDYLTGNVGDLLRTPPPTTHTSIPPWPSPPTNPTFLDPFVQPPHPTAQFARQGPTTPPAPGNPVPPPTETADSSSSGRRRGGRPPRSAPQPPPQSETPVEFGPSSDPGQSGPPPSNSAAPQQPRPNTEFAQQPYSPQQFPTGTPPPVPGPQQRSTTAHGYVPQAPPAPVPGQTATVNPPRAGQDSVDHREITKLFTGYLDLTQSALEIADRIAEDPTTAITDDMHAVADRLRRQRQQLEQIATYGRGLHDLERIQIRATLHDIDAGITSLPDVLWTGEDHRRDVDRDRHEARGLAIADDAADKVTDILRSARAVANPDDPDLRPFVPPVRDALETLFEAATDRTGTPQDQQDRFLRAEGEFGLQLVDAHVEDSQLLEVNDFLQNHADLDNPGSIATRLVDLLADTPAVHEGELSERFTPEEIQQALAPVQQVLGDLARETGDPQRHDARYAAALDTFGRTLRAAGIDDVTKQSVRRTLDDHRGAASAHAIHGRERIGKWAERSAAHRMSTSQPTASPGSHPSGPHAHRSGATTPHRSTFTSGQRRTQFWRNSHAASAGQAAGRKTGGRT